MTQPSGQPPDGLASLPQMDGNKQNEHETDNGMQADTDMEIGERYERRSQRSQ